MGRGVDKYASQYIEPEAQALPGLGQRYDHVLVLPACAEAPSLLDGIEAAAHGAPGRLLCVLVVNGRQDAPAETHARNADLLDGVLDGLDARRLLSDAPRMVVGARSGHDVLLVDRASSGSRFDARQGVGLARKIGFDIALGLWMAGEGPELVHTTDADATLAGAHFAHDPECEAAAASALTYPFEHVPGPDGAVFERTRLYELYLRFWVLGLAHARSPYAFHTLGSTMAVRLSAYAHVRGVPKRLAGEDFYLMTKLAKVGPVCRPPRPPVRLLARSSARTPFGTGAYVRRPDKAELLLPPAERFVVLGRVLDALDDLADHAMPSRFAAGLRGLDSVALDSVASERHLTALERVCRSTRAPEERRIRLHQWFDGFRTFKLLRGLERTFPSAPWRAAVAAAPFVPGTPTDVGVALDTARQCEAMLPALVGPAVRRS